MVSKRKFYKTMFIITVLSEDSINGQDYNAAEIHHMMVDGDWSGNIEQYPEMIIDAKQAAQDLIAQGSDPEFFRITEDGDDIDTGDDDPEPDKAPENDDPPDYHSNVPDFIGDYIRNH